MKKLKVGLVGIGKLGSGMMKHWDQNKESIGVYHPVASKTEKFIERFQNGYILTKRELGNLDVLILALPAKEIIPFMTNLISENISLEKTHIINMATALDTIEIKHKYPRLHVSGVKYMGHSRDLLDHGNALFITESHLPQEIEDLFQLLGRIKVDREERLIQVNKLATYYAAKAAIEIETLFSEQGLSNEYIQRALTSIAPEVMRSYSQGTLGHFALEIVKEIQLSKTTD
jgi:pyrroline-5-carboxylate reductase